MSAILYSFRRCPYAMRARLAIAYCLPGHYFELREVVLRDKPGALIKISPKATVPVVQLANGEVLEESLEIMLFALSQHKERGQALLPDALKNDIFHLIEQNDGDFKWALDRYKYSDRYEESKMYYREKGEIFLSQLNARLEASRYLMGEGPTLADLAIFPFIRQFAHVDKKWFDASPYQPLAQWLDDWLMSDIFKGIMQKYPQWHERAKAVYFPHDSQDAKERKSHE
ncbi:MAG: glutathione S-transferase [Pseudohongiella nitratireducens]|nr:glutathione S-transferase [Pseudohongiella nitratireducens]MDF1622032.1 glutathione S-transferase [Pseudohongiella nitratireducens]